MKKKFIYLLTICITTISYATTLPEAISLANSAPLLKSKEAKALSYKKLYEAQQSLDYPSLDLSYGGTYLKEKPVIYMNSSFAGLPSNLPPMQIQSQNQYQGTLKLTYPLFSGFAISSMIDKAKYEAKKVALEADDTKRNLYLGVVELYAASVSLKELIISERRAYDATKKSFDKAKAFFDLGLISRSELYRLDATLQSIQSRLIATKNSYKITLSRLSALVGSEITDISSLPMPQENSLEELSKEALAKRPDLLALKMMLQEQMTKIKLAKSGYYPNVALFAQASQIGDSTALNGDGFTNKDRSAAGFVINYNIFNGLGTTRELEAAKAAKLSVQEMLYSYKDKIKSEIEQSYLDFRSLQSQEKATEAQLKSQNAYEALVLGEFDNQLADADKLARAIASSAMARAALISIKAKLYTAYAKMLLEVDSEHFLRTLHLQKGKR